MENTAFFLVSAARALVEIAGLFLMGQGLLHVLAGASREQNGIYLLFRMLTRPVLTVFRHITPRVVIDRHLPFVAFFLLLWAWISLAYLRQMTT